MRKLAKEVGVTAPALYRHYDGREAVLADVVREAHHAFASYIYHALEAPTPVERLVRAMDGYLDFALENPRWYAIMFSGPERLGMETLPEDIQAMGYAIHQFWIDRVGECMRAGILKETDPLETSLTMWGHAHGLVQLYHQGHLEKDPEAFRRLLKDSAKRMMAGLATKEFVARFVEGEEPVPSDLTSGFNQRLEGIRG